MAQVGNEAEMNTRFISLLHQFINTRMLFGGDGRVYFIDMMYAGGDNGVVYRIDYGIIRQLMYVFHLFAKSYYLGIHTFFFEIRGEFFCHSIIPDDHHLAMQMAMMPAPERYSEQPCQVIKRCTHKNKFRNEYKGY
jgi:hypothetical protein